MGLKFSKKVQKKVAKNKNFGLNLDKKGLVQDLLFSVRQSSVDTFNPAWNYVLVFVLFLLIFGFLIVQLSSLQIAQGNEMLNRSKNNQIKIQRDAAYRGVILDRNGALLAENVASMNVYISIDKYLDEKWFVKNSELEKTSNTLEGILGDSWKEVDSTGAVKYSSISEKIYSAYEKSKYYFTDILISRNISDEMAIKIKAKADELPGVFIDSGSKRQYPQKDLFSHIFGYTGEVTADDLKNLEYVTSTDVVGRTGLERKYDERLIGEDGETAWEVDALGRTLSSEGYILKEPKAGENLYLTIDLPAQQKMYELIEKGVASYKAVGGAGIVQDVSNGELLALVSYPSYDNNLFIGGISHSNYNSLINNNRNPLLDRTIAAQMPPGSTFKVLVAAAALDAGVLKRSTIYVSRTGYTFTGGASFQEYGNNSYGSLNLIDAISVSSNIYFCELIRHWDMNKLVPYLEKFGIGENTGIDLLGEMPGRLPSPENKIALSKSSPWLEPVWYPEGDSCNSVIGQGITLVTPIQMVNWTSAIANGGKLNTPHIAKYFENEKKEKDILQFDPIRSNIVSSDALKIVREGMWNAVNGPRATIRGLTGINGVSVSAKTGTAEFGRLNKKGEYEHTHAWVTTFFPYENPKYALTIFLEDGGQSYNAAKLAREMIIWMKENGYI